MPSRDEVGHGTFLAGVAAGSENRREGFSGAAPLSELVVVKCKQAKNSYRQYYGLPPKVEAFQENDIMAGIMYILRIAYEAGKPVVICIGVGTSMGSHNGGSSLSSLIDRNVVYRGVGILACAGNEGNARHHHDIRKKEDVININVEEENAGFMAQLWWRTPGALEISITSPRGETVTGIRAVSGKRESHRFSPENTEVSLFFASAQEFTREQVVVFRFQSVRPGIWKIGVKSDFDVPRSNMWLPIRQFLESPVEFLEPDPDITICNPATGNRVITVSAYDVVDDSLYLQAGRGFTPDGIVKPEFAAPGVNIMGPFPRGRYGTMTGTGVATALAAGIGALFMQQYQDDGINGIMLREIFIRGATPRGVPYPNTEWGFGIVNAYESIVTE